MPFLYDRLQLAKPGTPHPDTPEFQPPAPTYDIYRTLRFAVFGIALGPLIGVWMRVLERAVPISKGLTARQETVQLAKRVFADQFLV